MRIPVTLLIAGSAALAVAAGSAFYLSTSDATSTAAADVVAPTVPSEPMDEPPTPAPRIEISEMLTAERLGDRTVEQRRLRLAGDPPGPANAIALRFLRSLQRQDHWAAAAELGLPGRAFFANHEPAVLHIVMADVASQARITGAGDCATAEAVNEEAVAVRCGDRVVVVHVSDGIVGTGVRLSSEHVADDRWVGPHTHAATSYEIG